MLKRLATWMSRSSRARRAAVFLTRLQPGDDDRIVDLGGGTGNHFASVFPFRSNVTIADLSAADLAQAASRHGFRTCRIDGTERLPFEDGQFDIVFCSSVLEHVTGPKEEVLAIETDDAFRAVARRHQAGFAAEIRRIGRSYFVQTPYRYFPVESHTWLPVVIVLLPRGLQKRVMAFFGTFWPKRSLPDWHLLTASELAELFPDAVILREYRFGFVKSLIAIRVAPDRH